MFVIFNLDGTSNSTSSTFTLPNNSLIFNQIAGRFVNNGVLTTGFTSMAISSNVITLFSSITSTTWTASGTKVASGQFFIEIA
jgi:N-acetyl-beta-hexosaminidase